MTTGVHTDELDVTDVARVAQVGSPTTRTWYWANWACVMASHCVPVTRSTVKPLASAACCSRLGLPDTVARLISALGAAALAGEGVAVITATLPVVTTAAAKPDSAAFFSQLRQRSARSRDAMKPRRMPMRTVVPPDPEVPQKGGSAPQARPSTVSAEWFSPLILAPQCCPALVTERRRRPVRRRLPPDPAVSRPYAQPE